MEYSSNNWNTHHIFWGTPLIVWKEMALAERFLFVSLSVFKQTSCLFKKLAALKFFFGMFVIHIWNTQPHLAMFFIN